MSSFDAAPAAKKAQVNHSSALAPATDVSSLPSDLLPTENFAPSAAKTITPAQVMALQRSVGNQVVQRMLHPSLGKKRPSEVDEQRPSPQADSVFSVRRGGDITLQRTPLPPKLISTPSHRLNLIQRKRVIANDAGHVHETKDTAQDDVDDLSEEVDEELGNPVSLSDGEMSDGEDDKNAPKQLSKKERKQNLKRLRKANALRNKAIKRRIRQIQRGKKVRKYSRFDDVEISDDERTYVRDIHGNVVWYPLADNPRHYILASKSFGAFTHSTRRETEDVEHEESSKLSKTKDVIGSGGDFLNLGDDWLVEQQRGDDLLEDEGKDTRLSVDDRERVDYAEGGLWAAGGLAGAASGILGMALSLRKMSDKESSTWDQVEAAFEFLVSGIDTAGGTAGMAGGVSSIISTSYGDETSVGEEAGLASGITFSQQALFGAISSGVKTVLDLVSLVKMVIDQFRGDGAEKEEWGGKFGELLIDALDTAKGVVASIRAIWELIGDTITTGFEQVFPAIDIAIAAIKTVFQGYYLGKSAFNWWKMVSQWGKAKKELKKNGYSNKDIKEARSFYTKKEGLIANTDKLIHKNDKRISKSEKNIKKSKRSSNYRLVRNWRSWRGKKWSRTLDSSQEKKAKLEELKGRTQSEIVGYENGQMDRTGEWLDDSMDPSMMDESMGDESMGDEGGMDDGVSETFDEPEDMLNEGEDEKVRHVKRLELGEIDVSGKLAVVNAKRMRRQAIHIGANLVKIAGSIVTIVGGTGAPAGLALKAASGATELSLPVFRALKQFGRNKAGVSAAKERKNLYTMVFNPNKSNVAKFAHTKKQAVTILSMIGSLYDLLPNHPDPTQRALQRAYLSVRAKQVEDYMRAAGVSPKRLYKHNGDPKSQVKLLVEAMYKREII